MDEVARDSCLRCVRLVARSARLCATVTRVSAEGGDAPLEIDGESPQYKTACASACRMLIRAQSYFDTMAAGHALTERPVRLVATALAEARQCAAVLALPGLTEPEDLERMAEKIERAIDRAAPSILPPAE